MNLWTTLFVLSAGAAFLALRPADRRSRARDRVPGPAGPDPPGDFPLVLTEGPDPVVLPEKSRYQHLELVGGSGTGKNYHGLLPMIHQDLRRGACVVVLDPKGSMRPAVESYARSFRRGRGLRCLDLGEPSASDTYNPLAGDDPFLTAERVHAALFSGDATPTSYYRDLALGLLHACLGLCHGREVLPTLGQLRLLAREPRALEALAALEPGSGEARELRGLLRRGPREHARDFQGLANHLTPLCGGPFARLFDTVRPGIVLPDLLREGGVLYAGLAADRYPSAARRVGTLLLMDLQSCLTRRYASRDAPCFVYLDEFADLAYPQARALVAKAREGRVGLVLAHQGVGDLGRPGSGIGEAVFGNTANKVLLRQGSPDSALALARLSGLRGGEEVRRGLSGEGTRGPRSGRPPEAGGASRWRFEPNDLLDLAVGEALLITQHSGGRRLSRGRLPPAPPWRRRSRAWRPAPGRAFAPLVLDLDDDAPRRRPDPGTRLGRAALRRLGERSRP